MGGVKFHQLMVGVWALGLVLLTALFWRYPEIDLYVSQHFFDPKNVHRFPLMYDPMLRFIQKSVDWAGYILAAGLPLWLASCALFPSLKQGRFCHQKASVALLVLAVGPGLMVQLATKEVFERPRPVHVKAFNGEYPYVKPLMIGADEGKSFVSGHAAMGFYMAVFALFLGCPRKRAALYIAAIALGLALGGCRIVQGRHFLSDILFSGTMTLMVVHLSFWGYAL